MGVIMVRHILLSIGSISNKSVNFTRHMNGMNQENTSKVTFIIGTFQYFHRNFNVLE